jgi:hypothetical protein
LCVPRGLRAVVEQYRTLELLRAHGVTLELANFMARHADYCWRLNYAKWLDGMSELNTNLRV